jgi:hypothetical protein
LKNKVTSKNLYDFVWLSSFYAYTYNDVWK